MGTREKRNFAGVTDMGASKLTAYRERRLPGLDDGIKILTVDTRVRKVLDNLDRLVAEIASEISVSVFYT